MSLIAAMQGRAVRRPKLRRWDPLDDRWYEEGANDPAGSVTPDTAMENSAVWLAVSLVSATMGSLPLKLMRQTLSTRKPARNHPLFDLLHRDPNPWQTAFEFREMLQGHLLTRGNAYNEIVKNRRGIIRELVPLNPALMEVEVGRNRRLTYIYKKELGNPRVYRQDQILHLHGMSSNGVTGYSPVTLARESFGLTKSQEKQGSRWMTNQARPSGALTTDETLSEDQRKNLKASWQAAYGGDNLGKVAVLEHGINWEAIGFDAENLQFLDSRTFQIQEVSRWFNVPPNKLFEWSRSHFDNVEQANLSWVIDSVRPWAERWEQRLDKALLTDKERSQGYFFKFSLEGLLRGDSEARGQFYKTLFEVASITPNEIRESEDMNPQGEDGDQLFVPLNLVPLDLARETAEAKAEPPDEPDPAPEPETQPEEQSREYDSAGSLSIRRQYQRSYHRMLADIAQRIVNKEASEVQRADKAASGKPLFDRLEKFYTRFEGEIAERLTPLMVAYAELVTLAATQEVDGEGLEPDTVTAYAEEYTRHLAKRYVTKSQAQIRKLYAEAGLLSERAAEWKESRAHKLALAETIRAGGAFAKLAYIKADVPALRWHSFGDGCPLHGHVAPLGGVFVEKGASIGGIRALRDISHPGFSAACSCLVAATEKVA